MNLSTLRALVILCAGVMAAPVSAQNYQSRFSDIQFDSAKAPSTLHGPVEVDNASGAVSMAIPLGPGIGARGLHFTPAVDFRMAPQVSTSTEPLDSYRTDPATGMIVLSSSTIYSLSSSVGGGKMFPGYLDLHMWDLFSNQMISKFEIYSGESGGINGVVPADAAQGPSLPGILSAFGYGNDTTVAAWPRRIANAYEYPPPPADFAPRMTTNGWMAVCLANPAHAPVGTASWSCPALVLLVQGEVGYEFEYYGMVPHYYNYVVGTRGQHEVPDQTQTSYSVFQTGVASDPRYRLKRVLNRFGEGLSFAYTSDSNGYPATYSVTWINGISGGSPGQPCGPGIVVSGDPYRTPTVHVSYSGLSGSNPSYTIASAPKIRDASAAVTLTPDLPFSEYPSIGWELLLPDQIRDDFSGETVSLSYGYGPQVDIPATSAPSSSAPLVLSSIQFPGRRIGFNWSVYSYVRNTALQSWQGFRPYWPESWCYGVSSVTDQALKPDGSVDGSPRVTSHQRAIPTMSVSGTAPVFTGWAATEAHDLVTEPDGSQILYKYASPFTGTPPPETVPSAPTPYDLQSLAFITNALVEERHYLPGQDGNADLANPAESSTAYMRARFGGNVSVNGYAAWSLDAIANPYGSTGYDTRLYPTMEEDWRTDGVDTRYTQNLLSAWDPQGFGWGQKTVTTWLDGSIKSVVGESSAFQSDMPDFWMARKVDEKTTVQSDSSGGLVPGLAFPQSLPERAWSYDALNRLTYSSITGADGLQIDAANQFLPSGPPSLALAELQGVTLSGAITSSGAVGIQQYQYDSLGHLKLIQPKGAAWNLQRQVDPLGRILSQTDANGVITQYTYDPSGRLTDIIPPAPEIATHIAYNSDFRHVTVSRGAQSREFAYNGYGELIREGRFDGQAWSYKLFGYDSMGRKTGETLWLSAAAADENQWWNPNLVASTTQSWPAHTVCRGWMQDDTGQAVCTRWVTIPAGTSTTPPVFHGTVTTYDGQSRVQSVTDPNGVQTAFTYGLLSRSETAGSGAEQRTAVQAFDALGRLVRITDAKNQVTQYWYDPAGRINRVMQMDPATQASQVRTWTYDTLGRLTAVTQPESGTTIYSAFTATGKPTATTYGYGSASPRAVAASYDALDRVTSITASDGSVNQAFVYDDSTRGAGNGRLTSANASGVIRDLAYNGLNGRLSSLTWTVDGRSFTMGLGYDAYGDLTSRTYPDGKVETISYDLARGVPGGALLNGAALASFGYDPVHWGLTALTYGNGGNSFFGYDTDQARLKTMTHLAGSQQLASWAFAYDSLGQLLTDGEDAYGYDALGRLVNAYVRDPLDTQAGHGLQQTFSYDAFGNRTGMSSQKVTNWAASVAPPGSPTLVALTSDPRPLRSFTMTTGETTSLAATNHLPATVGGASTGGAYDAQGNLTAIWSAPGVSTSQVTMAYDALGRVTTLGDTAHSTSQTYAFDDEGLRIKALDSATSLTKYAIYDEGRKLIAQYEVPSGGSLTWKKDLVYVGAKEVAEVDSTGKTRVEFLDHLGSPRFEWDGTATGAVDGVHLIAQKYAPFGEYLNDPATQSKFAKGFTNHEQTDPSGLIYMQARFYAPMYGRFLSPDPARDQHFEQTQSWNIYSYVQNDPTMRIDPTGMVNVFKDDYNALKQGVRDFAKGFARGMKNFGKDTGSSLLGHETMTAMGVNTSTKGETLTDSIKNGSQAESFGHLVAAVAPFLIPGAGEEAGGARLGAEVSEGATSGREASSAVSGMNLQKQLASEAQLSEPGSAMAGVGERKAFNDAGKKAAAYGGDATDYKKMTSSTFEAKDGTRFETHWVQNTKTGEGYEHKTKILTNEKKKP